MENRFTRLLKWLSEWIIIAIIAWFVCIVMLDTWVKPECINVQQTTGE